VIVGIIPARGGSKGIPRKNLSPLANKSLLQRGIELLQNIGCDKVFVSTEDPEIAQATIFHGADVIERPMELAQDLSGTEPVLFHAIEYLNLSNTDILVLHQLTSPLITVASAKKCLSILVSEPGLNSTISGLIDHSFMWREESDGTWSPFGHSRDHRPRRQDLPNQASETGGIYAARVGEIIQQQCRFPQPTKCIEVSFIESMDIDTPQDLKDAFKILNGEAGRNAL
jgi:N-acylneuraminate cytidylyltransferase